MRIKVGLYARNIFSDYIKDNKENEDVKYDFSFKGEKISTLIKKRQNVMNVKNVIDGTFEGQRIHSLSLETPNQSVEILPVMLWYGAVGKENSKYYFEKNSDGQSSMGRFNKGLCEFYFFKNNIYYIFGDLALYDSDEKALFVKEYYYKQSAKFDKLQKEIRLFEKMEKMEIAASREPIPEEVRFAIWRRDEGKCVKCGSKEKLEFDHIIPVSKGGSNTERNLQILCEKCNRTKSASI